MTIKDDTHVQVVGKNIDKAISVLANRMRNAGTMKTLKRRSLYPSVQARRRAKRIDSIRKALKKKNGKR
jgi:ribosomal protein S21